jgi:hypothetical protein
MPNRHEFMAKIEIRSAVYAGANNDVLYSRNSKTFNFFWGFIEEFIVSASIAYSSTKREYLRRADSISVHFSFSSTSGLTTAAPPRL